MKQGVKAPPQFPGLKQFPLYESLLEPPLKNGKIPAYARKKRHPFFDTNFDCLMIGSILRVKVCIYPFFYIYSKQSSLILSGFKVLIQQ